MKLHFFRIKKVFTCLLILNVTHSLYAEDSAEYHEITYPLYWIQKLPLPHPAPHSYTHPIEEAKARLTQNGVDLEKDKRAYLTFDGNTLKLNLKIEQHHQLYEILFVNGLIRHSRPEFCQATLYWTVERHEAGKPSQRVRYFCKLGTVLSTFSLEQEIKLQLEPIFTRDDLLAISPQLPTEVSATLSLNYVHEEKDSLSLQIQIESPIAPSMNTELSIAPNQLHTIAGIELNHDSQTIESRWEIRAKRLGQPRFAFLNNHETFQKSLDADNQTTEREKIIVNYLDQAGVDFQSHPRNRFKFDGSQYIVRLPPADMKKMRAIMENYGFTRQVRTECTISHSKNTASAHPKKLKAFIQGMSGRVTEINSNDISLYGLPGFDSFDTRFSLESVAIVEENESIFTKLECIAQHIDRWETITHQNEITSISGQPLTLADFKFNTETMTHAHDFTLRSTSIEPEPVNWPAAQIITEFIPISTHAITVLTKDLLPSPPDNTEVDPFAPNSPGTIHQSERETALKKILREHDILFNQHPDTELAYDGTQLIVSHTQETLNKIRDIVNAIDYPKVARCHYQAFVLDTKNTTSQITANLLSTNNRTSRMVALLPHKSEKDQKPRQGFELKITPHYQHPSDPFSLKGKARFRLPPHHFETNSTLETNHGQSTLAQESHAHAVSNWSVEQLTYEELFEGYQ